MNLTVKNVGPLNDVSIKLNKLTVLCGNNNSGKTYLIYALYSILTYIRNKGINVFTEQDKEVFCNTGKCSLKVEEIAEAYANIFKNDFHEKFSEVLAKDLAIAKSKTANSVVELSLEKSKKEIIGELISSASRDLKGRYTNDIRLRISHEQNNEFVVCEFLPQQTLDSQGASPLFPLQPSVFEAVEWLFPIFIQRFLLKPFVITCERNGIAMFGDELRMFYAFLFEASHIEYDKFQELKKKLDFKGYPLPIRRELEFSINLKNVQNRVGALAHNAAIIQSLSDLTGGHYSVQQDVSGSVSFSPKEDSSRSLVISECSSSVRSLVEINYYIRHMSGKNDLLIIDEPELDLHPSLQRKFARLLVKIVNAGTQVFIATHSDYIAREINTLISAYSTNNKIRERNATVLNCNLDELISPDDVSCYVISSESLMRMDMRPGFGYPIKSFDDNIQAFNESYMGLRESIMHDEEEQGENQ